MAWGPRFRGPTLDKVKKLVQEKLCGRFLMTLGADLSKDIDLKELLQNLPRFVNLTGKQLCIMSFELISHHIVLFLV